MQVIAAILFLLAVWAVPASAQTIVPLPQGGTVTFCETRTQGTFITGDPWIIGPVTICDRTTKDVDHVAPHMHGCMVNPVPPTYTTTTQNIQAGVSNQGWDDRVYGNSYDYSQVANKCYTFPSSSIANNSSILFATSLNPCTSKSTGGVKDYQCIYSMDVVTVLASNPGAVFRPAWTGTDKSYRPAESIRYNVLKDHPLVTNQPTLATLETEGIMRGPMIHLSDGSESWERLAPVSRWNMIRSLGSTNQGAQAYGRAINHGISDVIAALHSDYTDAQKRTMAIRWIQTAIDLYGQLNSGRTYYQAKGGFCYGHNTIMLVGASLLNNQAMMDAASIAAHPSRFCQQFYWKLVEQIDVDTARAAFCGSNKPTTASNGSICVAFTAAMKGRVQGCWNLNTWEFPGNPNCTASWHYTYDWINQGFVMQALALKWMSLKAEYGWDPFFDFQLNEGTALAWGDGRWGTLAQTQQTGTDAPCSNSSNFQSSALRQYICTLYTTYKNETPTEGSISGAVSPNVGPTSALVGPSAGSAQATTAATITFTGTAADSDGTVSSTTCASTRDAVVTNSGTPTAWSCTVDLPLNSVSNVTITSTDNNGAVALPINVSVLRGSATCTGLSDSFSLAGTWSTPNPACWVNMAGSLLWTNNHLESAANARNLFYYNSPINADQQASVTLDVTPSTDVWVYGLVRSALSGSLYQGMSCTAQNPISYIARFVVVGSTAQRQQLGAGIDMTAGGRTPWVSGDSFQCRMIGQQVCILKAGVVQGSCETDPLAVFTGGNAGGGAWGVSTGFSNFVATAQAGAGDIQNPLVSVTTPASVLQVSSTPYTLAAGTGSDNVGIVSCTWSVAEYPAVNGTCGGTALPNASISWTIPSIALSAGNNTFRVVVMDAAGGNATASQLINYVPASSVVATFTYPNSAATWTQRGRLVDLMGTMTAAQCTSVLLTNASDPSSGGSTVVATGADSWAARVAMIEGLNDVQIDCMNGAAGTGTSLLTVHKMVTSVPLKKRR